MKQPTLIIMGSAGSGKGTQSNLLEEQLGYHVAEAGAILRSEGSTGSDLGKKVMEIINSGGHLPDQMVTDIIKQYIVKISNKENLLIDGYPRTVEQKKLLDAILKESGREPENVLAVWIKVEREETERRLSNRTQCTVCKTVFMNKETNPCPHCGGEVKPRAYDYPESIKKRLDFFDEEILPIIEEYRSENKLIEVNGMQEVAHVHDEIKSKLKDLFPVEDIKH